MLQTAPCPSCGAHGEEQIPAFQKCLLPVDTSVVVSPSRPLVTQEDNPSPFFSWVVILLLIQFTGICPVLLHPRCIPACGHTAVEQGWIIPPISWAGVVLWNETGRWWTRSAPCPAPSSPRRCFPGGFSLWNPRWGFPTKCGPFLWFWLSFTPDFRLRPTVKVTPGPGVSAAFLGWFLVPGLAPPPPGCFGLSPGWLLLLGPSCLEL